MKAKEYLQQLKRFDILINQKIKEVHDLRLKLHEVGSMDYAKERVHKSPSADAPFVKVIGRIIDLGAEIDADVDAFVDKKHQIVKQIQQLRNADSINLLYKHYVEYKSFVQICEEMNFSYDRIRHLHGYALQEFQDKYLNSTQESTRKHKVAQDSTTWHVALMI